MDVYGYQMYQYNQSDDIAKQMLARQAQQLSSQLPDREFTEPHTMPAPSEAPWNVRGLSWGMPSPPQLVQFTASPLAIEPKYSPVIHCKRKSLDVEPIIPAKQFITEERMAAHLNSMHISSEYTSHSLASDEMMDIGMDVPSTSTTDISEKLKGHTIVLSEEVKKITEESLLPPAILDRLEKPRMSLVVWKPRENILEKLKEEKKVEEEHPRRNGVLVPEHSGIQDIEM
ncbi:hypothetical protein K1T71_011213 [Dendrolimus kikuchii]|uniref:Uncharacterized protein n=1 Tax=Dendrolimus kikuchii TaxID=765133 RepID=A0ACC1CNJ4_9NEOP|nr:hypothetical protein K1T71_011213 [Dendrolimus kikuchii]